MNQAKPEFDAAFAAEREMLSRLVTGDEDAAGLIAYSLHRRAVVDWVEAFMAAESRFPDAGEWRVFLLGEGADRRIAAYRERAALMLAADEPALPMPAPALSMPPKRQPLRTWFWPWGFPSTFVVENPDQSLNWRGLLWRLLLLTLAVIVTALALRIFVIRS
ncbi:hypothetical protein MCEMSEM23_00177 [Rhabdaerophilaceae bacterium]